MDGDDATTRLAEDPVIGPLVERYGPVTLEPADDPFARLVRSIVRQQVSMAAGDAITERLFDRFEVTPAALASADTTDLTDVGLSSQKATYVREAARTFRDRGYDREHFVDLGDDEVIAELTEIRGVGVWTAKMFLMFCLARPDVFPVEDLGIRRAMHHHVDDGLSRDAMVERAEDWRPVRSYASCYLWRSID